MQQLEGDLTSLRFEADKASTEGGAVIDEEIPHSLTYGVLQANLDITPGLVALVAGSSVAAAKMWTTAEDEGDNALVFVHEKQNMVTVTTMLLLQYTDDLTFMALEIEEDVPLLMAIIGTETSYQIVVYTSTKYTINSMSRQSPPPFSQFP